jgi:hypothetical protein
VQPLAANLLQSAAKPANKNTRAHVDTHAARVAQYKAHELLPQVAVAVDKLRHENYHIPVLEHGNRKLVTKDTSNTQAGGVVEFSDADYVDAYRATVHAASSQAFRNLETSAELAALERINISMRVLLDGGSVADSVLSKLLSADAFAAYKLSLTSITHHNEDTYGDGMPSELRAYTAKLQLADFQNNKYEKMNGMRSVGRAKYTSAALSKTLNNAEILYESALEMLQEIWSTSAPYEQQQLQSWMDREIDFDAGAQRTIGICVDSIPRVRGSRSVHALDAGLPKLSQRLKRRECQLSALSAAATVLVYEPAPVEVEVYVSNRKLRELLNAVCDDDLY